MSTLAKIAALSALRDRTPCAARAADVDLVVVRIGDEVHVLSGRCPHRGARLADGFVDGNDLVCRSHGWDFCVQTGVSEHVKGERLGRFTAIVDRERDGVFVDEDEVSAWHKENPQSFEDDEFLDG